ncbi:MAG: hypothetical protein KC503_36420 [Myxococcales bacterium]|nr:hypothetical protein [Myxococcales bacterium]
MRTSIIVSLLAILAVGCGDSGNTTPDSGAPEVGTGETAANPCAKCASDEVCVQSFDGTCTSSGPYCLKVEAKCRNITAQIGTPSNPCATPIWDAGAADGGDGGTVEKGCSEQYCSQPYSCANGSPCGTEHAAAQVYCYGP